MTQQSEYSRLKLLPGKVYKAPLGTPPPADDPAAANRYAAYNYLGWTNGGVNVNINTETTEIRADQELYVVDHTVTGVAIDIQTQLMRVDPKSIAEALTWGEYTEQPGTTTAFGFRQLDLPRDDIVLGHGMYVVETKSQEKLPFMIVFYEAVAISNVQLGLNRGNPSLLPVRYVAVPPQDTTKPVARLREVTPKAAV
jgi:hypothetical protein